MTLESASGIPSPQVSIAIPALRRPLSQMCMSKRNALACGFARATGYIIALIDTDGSVDPRETLQSVTTLLECVDFAKAIPFVKAGVLEEIPDA